MDKELHKKSMKLAGKFYSIDDTDKKDSISKGLATTHEQVSDVYTEGQITPKIEDTDGEDQNISKRVFD